MQLDTLNGHTCRQNVYSSPKYSRHLWVLWKVCNAALKMFLSILSYLLILTCIHSVSTPTDNDAEGWNPRFNDFYSGKPAVLCCGNVLIWKVISDWMCPNGSLLQPVYSSQQLSPLKTVWHLFRQKRGGMVRQRHDNVLMGVGVSRYLVIENGKFYATNIFL